MQSYRSKHGAYATETDSTGSLKYLYQLLNGHFGPLYGPEAVVPWWPIYGRHAEIEIVLGAILVQRTRWEMVEDAILRLLDAALLDVAALAATDTTRLSELLRPIAFAHAKSPAIIGLMRHIQAEHQGSITALLSQRPVAQLRQHLLEMPRIGPETADVMLLYAGRHPVFVVDLYTRRLFERVNPPLAQPLPRGWARTRYELVRAVCESELAGDTAALQHVANYHALINEVSVRYCLARAPRCDGPPSRRVYSRQPQRNAYLNRDDGCPLRVVCDWYHTERQSATASAPSGDGKEQD